MGKLPRVILTERGLGVLVEEAVEGLGIIYSYDLRGFRHVPARMRQLRLEYATKIAHRYRLEHRFFVFCEKLEKLEFFGLKIDPY